MCRLVKRSQREELGDLPCLHVINNSCCVFAGKTPLCKLKQVDIYCVLKSKWNFSAHFLCVERQIMMNSSFFFFFFLHFSIDDGTVFGHICRTASKLQASEWIFPYQEMTSKSRHC